MNKTTPQPKEESIEPPPAVQEVEPSLDINGRDGDPAIAEAAACRESDDSIVDGGFGMTNEQELEWDYFYTDQHLGAAVSLVRISSPASADLSDLDSVDNNEASNGTAAAVPKPICRLPRRRRQSADARCRCHDSCGNDNESPRQASDVDGRSYRGRRRGHRRERSRNRRMTADAPQQQHPVDSSNDGNRGSGRGRPWRGGYRNRRGRGRDSGSIPVWQNRERRQQLTSDSVDNTARGRAMNDGNYYNRRRGRGQSTASWWQHDCERISRHTSPSYTIAETITANGNDDTRSHEHNNTSARPYSNTSKQDCRFNNTRDSRT